MVMDRGAVEPFVLPIVGGLTAVTLLVAAVAGLLVGHQRANAAADLTALAAVTAADPCSAARTAALRNGARLETCTAGAADVHVIVSVPSGAAPLLRRAGAPEKLLAGAHASL